MAKTPDRAQAYEEAKRRIAKAARERSEALNLSELDLTDLPPEIGSLTALQTLSLFYNQLATLPREIGSLAALQTLHLFGNRLATLPPEIGFLTALQTLHLFGNRLATLPPEIGFLTALRTLHLGGNQLTTLPPEVGSLAELQTLYLNGNQLATLPPEVGSLAELQTLSLGGNQLATLPPVIGSLTALQTLDLSRNRLATLPPVIGSLTALQTLDLSRNGLAMVPVELKRCKKLKVLFLHGNQRLQIPASVLGPPSSEVNDADEKKRKSPARPADILNFYFARQSASEEGRLQTVGELKVMLVGRGGAGKTSLRRFFLGQPHDAKEPETPGIALDDFKLPCHRGEITVHLWDFAGQEITHALHQFFLTEGCVYVVVLDPRSNTEMTDAVYWLDQLKRYAPTAPVIVALNRQDARQGGYDVDRDLLRERYPQIRYFVPTNCSTRSGCLDLRSALTQAIEQLEPTEPPRLKVPGEWIDVKAECWGLGGKPKKEAGILSRLLGISPADSARRKHTLTFKEFSVICDHHGIREQDKQESLARLLHKLGAVLHFVDDPRLRDMSVLNPHWVTDGVYRLLRFKDRPGSDGILTIAEAIKALDEGTEAAARYLLGLMERFEMCFPAEEDAAVPTRWLIPGALNPYQPPGVGEHWKGAAAVRLRYDYGGPVAEGILPRFIVLTHPLKGEHVWRNGVVLRDGEAAALVRRGENLNHVEVTALGPDGPRLRLLELVQGTMERVNGDLPGKPPRMEQEIAGLPGVYKAVAELRVAEVAETRVVVASEPSPGSLVDPTPQLDRTSERESRDPARVPLRAFLSYSHEDRSAKNIFQNNLAVMQNRNLISSWHDGMIGAGTDWKKAIDEQLDRMDVFIGLLTTSFLASDFIQRVELKAARARLRERERRDFLFVLIVVDDNLSLDFDLSQYQLLYPGSKPLSKHPNRKAFFNQAQKEIEQLIKAHRFCDEGPGDNDGDDKRRGRRVPRSRQPSDGGVVGVTIINVTGDFIKGDKDMGDDNRIQIGGNVINSQVAQNLTNSTNMIQQQAPGERKQLLDQLRGDVEALIKQLPKDKVDEAPQVAENLEMLVKQATSEKPNRKWYEVSAEGLLDASKWTKEFAGNIFGTVGQIGKMIWPDFKLPKGE